VVNGLALGVEDSRFERDEDARFHVIAYEIYERAAPMTSPHKRASFTLCLP
jgi:hypothetical protein